MLDMYEVSTSLIKKKAIKVYNVYLPLLFTKTDARGLTVRGHHCSLYVVRLLSGIRILLKKSFTFTHRVRLRFFSALGKSNFFRPCTI